MCLLIPLPLSGQGKLGGTPSGFFRMSDGSHTGIEDVEPENKSPLSSLSPEPSLDWNFSAGPQLRPAQTAGRPSGGDLSWLMLPEGPHGQGII